MFSAKQIFIFSLVPLALVFAGVIGGSFHGKDSSKEVFPSGPPPVATPTPRAMTSDSTAPRLVALDAQGASVLGVEF